MLGKSYRHVLVGVIGADVRANRVAANWQSAFWRCFSVTHRRLFILLTSSFILSAVSARAQYNYNLSSQTNTINVVSNWAGNGTYVVGSNTVNNALIIDSGGVLSNGTGIIGYVATSAAFNSALVTGTGVWSNRLDLFVGLGACCGTLTISDGGAVYSDSGYIGYDGLSGFHEVLVTGTGSVWNTSQLYVGYGSAGGAHLTITNGGSVIATNVTIGFDPVAVNNRVFVKDGNLFVTNALGNGALDYQSGLLLLRNGTVTVDRLSLTNLAVFIFQSGLLNSKGTVQSTTVTNFEQLVVGDGTNTATFHLLGGVHSFSNVLHIANAAFLTGCGTITGNLLVDSGGSVLADCGSSMNFSGIVTNNGTITATGGTAMNFYGPTVNNGTIIATNGSAQFYSTLVNNGTILPLPPIVNSWRFSGSGPWDMASRWSRNSDPSLSDGVDLITNGVVSKTVSISNITATSSLTISNLHLQGFGSFTNTLQLTTTNTLVVLNTLIVGTNAVLSISNSNLRVDGLLGGSFFVDGAVTLNGGSIVALSNLTTTVIGNNTGGSLTMSGGTMSNRDLFVGNNAGASGALTIAGGTNIVADVFTAGKGAGATGTVFIAGGLMVVTNASTLIGSNGVAEVSITNGTVLGQSLTVGSGAGGQGTLTVAGGTYALMGPLAVGASGTGTVCVSGGQLVITNTPATVGAGSGFIVDGPASLAAGSTISVTNLPTTVGNRGSGSLTVNGGTMVLSNVTVGNFIGSRGTLTVDGGTTTLSDGLAIGSSAGALGTVWMTGGQLEVTNTATSIGNAGDGQMTVSNGTWLADGVTVGRLDGSQGTLTVAGGTNTISQNLHIGTLGGATGAVWVTGGRLVNTKKSSTTYIGEEGVGQMTVSNGTWLARVVIVAALSSSQGTLTVAGGTSSVFSNLTIGDFPCSPTGTVVVTGGNLFVTNSTTTAVLEVRSGTLQLNSGTLVIDQLVITNSCGRFVHYGGTLLVGNTNNVLPDLDADGDGLPNSFEQTYGLDPFNDTGNDGPSGDPDGDGFTNLQESQAGTDPNDSSSSFRITAVTKEGNGLRITWSMGPGKSNVLQRTAGTANGSYSNNFADIFTIPYTVGTTTNYLDVGGATNFPSRYYRIRLVP